MLQTNDVILILKDIRALRGRIDAIETFILERIMAGSQSSSGIVADLTGNKPVYWVKPRQGAIPCVKCGETQCPDSKSQAVIVTSSRKDRAFFKCRVCNHTWGMPARPVETGPSLLGNAALQH